VARFAALVLVRGRTSNAQVPGAGQLARMMGTKWKELSEAEKAVRFPRLTFVHRRIEEVEARLSIQPYVEKHERDKERAATDKQQHEVGQSHQPIAFALPDFGSQGADKPFG